MFSACTFEPAVTSSVEDTQPENVALEGIYVCLPHKDGSALIPDECAPGLQTEEGKYYGLDFYASPSSGFFPPDVWNLKLGESFIFDGELRFVDVICCLASGIQWQNYPIDEVFFPVAQLQLSE